MSRTFLLIIFFYTTLVFSQNKQKLEVERITIIKSYTPEIVNAQKKNIVPKKEKSIPKEKVSYNLLKLPNTYNYTPKKIIPIEPDFILKQDSMKNNNIGEIYLGYANYNTYYGEFFISDFIDNSRMIGINGKYMSVDTRNNDNNKYNQNFRDGFFKGFYNQYWNKYFLKVNMDYLQNKISFFGIPSYINENNYTKLHPKDLDLTNDYKNLDLKANFLNYEKIDSTKFFTLDKIKTNINYFEDLYFTNELNFDLETSLSFRIENINLGTEIKFESQNTTLLQDTILKNININNYIFYPYVKYKSEGFSIGLGANIFYNQNNTANDGFKIYPKFNLEYSPNSSAFTIFSNVDGGYILNRISKVTKENSWIIPQNFDMFTSDMSYTLSLGMKGNIITNLRYKTGMRYEQINDNMLWIPNINFANTEKQSFPDMPFVLSNSFQSYRSNTTLLDLFIDADYSISSDKTVGMKASFFIPNSDTLEFLYQPNLDIELYANISLFKKWQINTFIKYIGNRYALSNVRNKGIESMKLEKLDAYIDVNLNCSYSLNKNISFFVRLNNIINQKYQQFSNYNTLGIWAMGGLNYKF